MLFDCFIVNLDAVRPWQESLFIAIAWLTKRSFAARLFIVFPYIVGYGVGSPALALAFACDFALDVDFAFARVALARLLAGVPLGWTSGRLTAPL